VASTCIPTKGAKYEVNPAIVIGPATLSPATVNNAVTVTFAATGGSGTGYTFSESGALPAGLTFSNGTLSGTPTKSGSYSITVTATDSNGGTSSVSDTLTVNPAIVVTPSHTHHAGHGHRKQCLQRNFRRQRRQRLHFHGNRHPSHWLSLQQRRAERHADPAGHVPHLGHGHRQQRRHWQRDGHVDRG
jgi:hypothetical protein